MNKTGSHQDSQSLPLTGVIKNIIGKLFGMLEGAEGPVANKEVERGVELRDFECGVVGLLLRGQLNSQDVKKQELLSGASSVQKAMAL